MLKIENFFSCKSRNSSDSIYKNSLNINRWQCLSACCNKACLLVSFSGPLVTIFTSCAIIIVHVLLISSVTGKQDMNRLAAVSLVLFKNCKREEITVDGAHILNVSIPSVC